MVLSIWASQSSHYWERLSWVHGFNLILANWAISLSQQKYAYDFRQHCCFVFWLAYARGIQSWMFFWRQKQHLQGSFDARACLPQYLIYYTFTDRNLLPFDILLPFCHLNPVIQFFFSEMNQPSILCKPTYGCEWKSLEASRLWNGEDSTGPSRCLTYKVTEITFSSLLWTSVYFMCVELHVIFYGWVKWMHGIY